MGKKRETGLFERIFNAVTRTGTTVKYGRDFWGRPTRTEHNYDTGVTKKTVSRQGFFGNRDTTKYYDARGQYAERRGRRSLLTGSYSSTYSGRCFKCDGTGTYQPTGKTCRKCGGTGIYSK